MYLIGNTKNFENNLQHASLDNLNHIRLQSRVFHENSYQNYDYQKSDKVTQSVTELPAAGKSIELTYCRQLTAQSSYLRQKQSRLLQNRIIHFVWTYSYSITHNIHSILAENLYFFLIFGLTKERYSKLHVWTTNRAASLSNSADTVSGASWHRLCAH